MERSFTAEVESLKLGDGTCYAKGGDAPFQSPISVKQG
jgi:hypothetical protein